MFKVEATKTTCPSWLVHQMSEWEQQEGGDGYDVSHNRMYYFAIPPKLFLDSAAAIKATGVSETGWTRPIVENPFGRDVKSAQELTESLKQHFTEDYIYRIDHYLGQEMVQNMLITRFGNVLFEKSGIEILLKVCPSPWRIF
jgi:glucose-6-phosphate 1-dehydrogenase